MISPIIRYIGFLVPMLALASCSTDSNQAQRPNILLVVADDMGWTDLGSFGSEIATPNLDRLARDGVKFTSYYTSMSCSPTRSMLLSGTDNHLAGLGNMGELLTPEQLGQPGYEGHLNDRVVSLAEVLRENDYHTYMAGKWHLGHSEETIPHARGFDRSFSMLFGGASYWSDMFGLLAGQEEIAEYVEDDEWLDELPADFYATRSYADHLMESIRQHHGDGRPFLGYLAFTAPHDPMHVPEPWLSMYRGTYDDGYEALKARRAHAARDIGVIAGTAPLPSAHPMMKPWGDLDANERAAALRGMEVYAGIVANMDYHYGRVIQFLEDIGEYDNTIVVFMSDNGPNPWESEDYPGNRGSAWFAQFDNSAESIGHPMSHFAYGMGWGSACAGPLDLFKMTVGEGGIRTPLLIDGPGVDGGRQVDSFAYVWDVMPTLLDMIGIEHPAERPGRELESMRGRSLRGVLEGNASAAYGPAELVGGEMQNGKWMRKGDYKAVSVAPPYGDGVWRLFNVVHDPGETRNLSGENPGLLAELQEAWQAYAEDVGVILTE